MKFNQVLTVLAGVVMLLTMACSEQNGEPIATGETGGTAIQAANTALSTNSVVAMDVYKDPSCGCCGKWIEHAEQRGISLTTHHPEDLNQLKSEQGIAPEYQSCHTVVSEQGYVFEGHIPARYIHQFLAAPPADARGLAVPAMPIGSPGMEMDKRFASYQVLLLKRDGSAEVYAEVNSPVQQY